MASSGNGNKFVSVNLNKSYGQQGGSGIGHPGGGRSRPGGGHGGMLVLSRPRTTQGAAGAKGSKLSVPPPLNLPSLKREHGGTDPVAQTGAATSTSAPAGWIKPATPTNISDGEQVADGLAGKPATLGSGSSWGTSVAPAARPVNPPGNTVVTSADSGGRPSVYTPPAARAKNGAPGPVSAQAPALPVMLRGEDFPSLQASLPNVTMPQQKQRDAQQKQRRNQEDLKEQKLKLQQLSQQDFPDGVLVHQQTGPESQSSPPTMRPQVRPKQHNFMGENLHFQGGDRSRGLPGQHLRKPEGYSSGPPPLVRLDHTSNWADDERDTGRSERDYVKNDHLNTDDVGYGPGTFQRNGSFPSLGPVREGRDASTFSHFEKGNFRADFNSRENWQGGNDRDASFRRSSSFRKEGNFSSDMGFDRERVFPRSANISRENIIGRNFDVENKSIRGPYGRINGQSWEADNGWENLAGRNSFGKDNGTWDSSFRDGYGRDGGYSQEGHIGSHGRDGFLRRGGEQNLAAGRYGDTIGRNRGVQNDALQNNTWNKVSFSTGSRGMPINDPILNFGRDKRSFTSYGKPYSEDPLMKDFGSIPGFDLRDPFVGGLGTEIKVTKRRKDDSKQTDFYDPIRASFEAELERVQKMQEQERQRMIEEQERAQELARQEEEERQHRAREEEERQRRLEEEARESAWRAEQQALEAARRLEEERRAREEEKRRMILEEERRKEAARRKLLELEERIAKRQAENKKEQDMPTMDEGRFLTVRSVKDRDLRRADTGDWEDEERKIDRITSSASSESSNMSRSFDTGLRAQVLRDVNSFAPDRTKPPNSWRRDLSENGNGSHFSSQIMASDQTNSYQNSNWESVNGGRGILRRDLFEGSRTGSAKIIPKIGRSETMQVNDHIPYQNDQRRFNADTEVFVNTFDGYSDIAWGQEKNDSWRGRERPRIPSPISYTQSSEADEFAIGRSRHFRQPRVLPPPSVTALQKGLCKNGSEKPFSSPLLEEEPKRGLSDHDIESKGELSLEEDCAVMNEPFEAQASQNEHGSEEQQGLINMIRSESQSLPSVSSLPSSPAHVSHDDLEEAGSPIFQQNEAEMTASSNLDGTLHNVISAEGLKSDECTEYTSPPSKSVGQEIHEEWAFEDDGDFSEEEDYEEEHLYEEEDGIFEEEEENPEKKYDYNSLHSEHQKIEVKNDQELCNTKVELEVPVLTNLEEKTVLDGIGDSSEFHGNHDGSVHQELSLEGQNLVMVAEDNEHKLQENEVPGTQHEGSIDDKEGSDIVQQPVMQQPLVHQSPMEGTSGLASMEPLQIESDMQNSMQSLVQPPQFSLSSTHLSLPQSNISSATTSLGSSILAPISALPGQTELPFKLQFGLFPGTSIQIGSIQMPLHLHPHVFPSLTQIPPSQPTVFEFGQLRYPAPIQPPIPYVHPSVSAHFSLGQPVMPLSTQHILDSAIQNLSVREQQQNNISGNQAESMTPGLRSSHVNQHASAEENTLQESRGNMDKDQLSRNKFFKSGLAFKSNAGQYRSSSSMAVDNEQIKSSKYASEVETPVVNKIYKPFTNVPVISEQGQSEGTLVQSSSGGLQTGGRGRGNRTSYGVRTDGLRTSTNTSEALWSVSADARRPHKQGRRNVHRSEFRVSVDRRQLEVLDSNNLPRKEDKSRRYVQSDSGSSSMVRGAQKDLVLSAEKSMKLEIGSKAGYGTSLPSAHYEDKVKKMPGGKLPQRSGLQMTVVNGYHSTEGILKRNEKSEAADDVPLQSGIVRIFKQPGIETPSDEDDFIEVKTRRQIREQRDKEMKAKSKDMKPKDQAARRYRPPVKSAVQGDEIPAISHRGATSSGGEKRNSMIPSAAMVDFVPIDGRNLPIAGSSASLIASAAPLQQLAPIGTPAANSEGSNDKRSISSKLIQTSPAPTISHVDADMGKVVRFENQSPVQDGISSTGVGAWGSTRTSQQVVSLTQIQLEEAMKPVSFEAKRAPLLPLGDHGSMALESGLSVISVLAQDKPLSSAAPLNSLLAGEKIQFGAVTSPTLLPPSSCSIMPPVSIGLGPSVACRPDGSMESAFSASEGDSTNFFSKADDRCRQMVDPEAEAEAAASAVAVAAISSDDSTGNGLGGVSRSVSESKAFVNSDVGASSVGVSATRPVMIQSRGEDSMTVALPADLSVETPSPLSLWPSVASRQNSAGPVLSHFPGAPPPFPCFEMSPMMGGPIFAFGQHEEAPSLSQGQKSNTSVEQGISGIGAGPVGGWQQCHSGVDSFYGAPPSGYTGPFISPPGGIPGMQGPPPMFVYNPFPAVGQFGQVGFMSAYIPSGKQPDWKHTPASTSGVGLNEGDISSLGIMSGQRNPNMPTPVQHMPIVPSLGLFDMNLSSPFQSAVDLPMQTQWSHVPGPPTFQTMPMSGSMVGLSMPLQQTDGLSSQFNHPSHTIESGGSRFHQVLASKTPGSGPFSTVDAAAQFPDELGLGDSVSSNNSSVLTSRNLSSNNVNYNSLPSANVKVQKGKSSSRSARSSSTGSGSESSALALGTNHVTSNNQSLHGSHTVGHPFQTQVSTSQTTSGQYPHPVGYSEQRGMSQQHTGHKMSVASEWSAQGHRKIGGQGRSQISGDKNFTTSKMKQVYVVKPSSSTSNMGTPVTLL